MINLQHIDSDIIEALRNKGFSENRIESMTWDEAFDQYCEWEGLIGWGPRLRRAMANLKNAQDKVPMTW